MNAGLDCDVLIAGGGMVGISLALALDRLGGGRLRVVVAEDFAIPEQSTPAPVYRPSFDARSTALSYGSRCILERLEIWDTLAAHVAPITDIHVSERARFGSVSLHAAQRGWPARNALTCGVYEVPLLPAGETKPFEQTRSCVVEPPGYGSGNGSATVVSESSPSPSEVPVGAIQATGVSATV